MERLEALSVDAPIRSLTWSLYLPDRYSFLGFASALRPEDGEQCDHQHSRSIHLYFFTPLRFSLCGLTRVDSTTPVFIPMTLESWD